MDAKQVVEELEKILWACTILEGRLSPAALEAITAARDLLKASVVGVAKKGA